MGTRKHTMPAFLSQSLSAEAYERWLTRKTAAHVKRDRKRSHPRVTQSLYKEAIHAAVILSNGKGAYTGEALDWHLISKYDNEESKKGRHSYKSGFALLPTVDHVSAGATEASFRICSWRTNDAKNDLSVEDFLSLCERILVHAGYSVVKIA